MDDECVRQVADAIARTPLAGCVDEEGLAVCINSIWPDEIGNQRLTSTLHQMAKSAIRAYKDYSKAND